MHIAEIDAAGVWLGGYAVVSDTAVCPPGWRIMADSPPLLEDGELALAVGSAWTVIAVADRPDAPPQRLTRIAKIEFSRLFTDGQLIAYLALKAQAKALTAADFADPAKVALVQAAVMFEKFDMLPDLIELDHPETIAGVGQILVANGVVSESEAARILQGVPPA